MILGEPTLLNLVTDKVPAPEDFESPEEMQSCQRALDYMGLKSHTAIQDIRPEVVFIGSCTNSRIEDLRVVAEFAKGKKVADSIHAIVVPGSGLVKKQAEEEGIDRILKEAGFDWINAGCLCVWV